MTGEPSTRKALLATAASMKALMSAAATSSRGCATVMVLVLPFSRFMTILSVAFMGMSPFQTMVTRR